MQTQVEELERARTTALLRPTRVGIISARGKDRVSWLNGLVTCELANKKASDSAFGLIVGKVGKIDADVYIALEADALFILAPPDRVSGLMTMLDKHLVMEDVELEIAAASQAAMLVVGPHAKDLASAVSARGGKAVVVERQAGLTALVTLADEEALRAALPADALATDQGWERVRCELGLPERGRDFDETNYPQEASLERDAVAFDKGCYLGQEAVFMLEKRGHVKKRLVQLEIKGSASVGAEIHHADKGNVGAITSIAAREDGTSIALGFVRYKQAQADTELTVSGNEARVTKLFAIVPS